MKHLIHTILLLANIVIPYSATSQNNPDKKLAESGIEIHKVINNNNSYTNTVRSGNLIFLSGKGPLNKDGSYITGKLGKDLTIEEGIQAARLCAINHLAILKQELGSLSKIKRIIKVTGFVNSTPEFTDQPKIIDGFSLLIIAIFGESGQHARSAIGAASLPFGWPVEVEMIVEVYP